MQCVWTLQLAYTYWGRAQRLYLEVRHAVRQLYVQQTGSASAADAWFQVSSGGLKRAAADPSDLPGPCGGYKLHVQARAEHVDDDAVLLPKVC